MAPTPRQTLYVVLTLPREARVSPVAGRKRPSEIAQQVHDLFLDVPHNLAVSFFCLHTTQPSNLTL